MTDMRVIPNALYYDRLDRARARGRRQAVAWLALSLLLLGLMGLGIGTVAQGGTDPYSAAGGRVQPKTVPAQNVFKQALWRFTGHYTPHLMQNCMGAKCAVFTRDGGTVATFAKIHGIWRLRTIIVPDFSTLP